MVGAEHLGFHNITYATIINLIFRITPLLNLISHSHVNAFSISRKSVVTNNKT